MASSFTIPERFKLVNGTPMVTTNAAVDCDVISCKNAHKVLIVADFLQAVSHATVLGIDEATDVAAGTASAVTAVQKVWKNADISSTDTLVRGTDAATLACTAGATNQHLVIEFDPATLTAGYTSIRATTTASSQATDFVNINYYIETRYPQATPPSAIID